MNKTELVKAIASKEKLKLSDAERFVNVFIETVSEELKNKGKFTLGGIGTFGIAHRKQKTGVNPKTGEKIMICAKDVPVFKPAKAFTDVIPINPKTGKKIHHRIHKGFQYELFVREVLIEILKLSPDELQSSKKNGVIFPGGNPVKHQIDLYLVQKSIVAEYVTIIECKYRIKGKVDQEEIAKLAFVKSDVQASKAILVTNNGFTKGAVDLAKSQKIALLIIPETIEIIKKGEEHKTDEETKTDEPNTDKRTKAVKDVWESNIEIINMVSDNATERNRDLVDELSKTLKEMTKSDLDKLISSTENFVNKKNRMSPNLKDLPFYGKRKNLRGIGGIQRMVIKGL